MGGNHTPIVDQDWLEGNDSCWVTRYGAHLFDGGETCKIIAQRLRPITVQEAAAIQSLPADMEWRGTRSAVYRQIGNAVPSG
ncbi:DNA cytosine methyltransferase [Candidatus Poriferisodalis sp.]|uniref:DNA cytosine methyltransferase n=1 Tax=Candidatus Poriferisodalis sp. TaxID=3101277 RepID=UPI003B012774